jgi:antitoxin VapB
VALVYTSVYTYRVSERAKLFRNGGSQAVRLPKTCRFRDDLDEVLVRRVGKQVVLEPADEWPDDFLRCLGAWHDDIPRPKTGTINRKKNPFDRS